MGIDIATDPNTLTSCVIVAAPAAQISPAAGLVRADWNDAPFLNTAALHHALDGSAVAEIASWTGDPDAVRERINAIADCVGGAVPGATITSFLMRPVQVTRGPASPEEPFVLGIDAAADRPAMIGVFDAAGRGRPALLQYLEHAAVRLAAKLAGWTGAVLYAAQDGQEIIEYLQFESFAALAAARDCAAVHDHQRTLVQFGGSTANVYRVGASFPA